MNDLSTKLLRMTNAENAASVAKIGVETAENEPRRDLEKWTISRSLLVIAPAAQLPAKTQSY